MNNKVEELVERLKSHTGRDQEFLDRFGKWKRPDFARKYPLMQLIKNGVYWHESGSGIIDAEFFIKSLAPEDQRLAGEIARFVAEEYQGKYATDKVLNTFQLNLGRRLDSCGF